MVKLLMIHSPSINKYFTLSDKMIFILQSFNNYIVWFISTIQVHQYIYFHKMELKSQHNYSNKQPTWKRIGSRSQTSSSIQNKSKYEPKKKTPIEMLHTSNRFLKYKQNNYPNTPDGSFSHQIVDLSSIKGGNNGNKDSIFNQSFLRMVNKQPRKQQKDTQRLFTEQFIEKQLQSLSNLKKTNLGKESQICSSCLTKKIQMKQKNRIKDSIFKEVQLEIQQFKLFVIRQIQSMKQTFLKGLELLNYGYQKQIYNTLNKNTFQQPQLYFHQKYADFNNKKINLKPNNRLNNNLIPRLEDLGRLAQQISQYKGKQISENKTKHFYEKLDKGTKLDEPSLMRKSLNLKREKDQKNSQIDLRRSSQINTERKKSFDRWFTALGDLKQAVKKNQSQREQKQIIVIYNSQSNPEHN